MTLRTDARVAGVTMLVYIAAGLSSLALSRSVVATTLLAWVTAFCALILGVTFYAITRRQDAELALLALTCRVIEAMPGHGEIFFAVGSTIFCWLLWRGRMIPAALALFGFVASVLVVLMVVLQLAGWFGGARSWSSPFTWAAWLPLLVFEVTVAIWLIAKGVREPATYNESRQI